VALGAVYLVAGLVALSSVALATVVSVFIVGIAMVVAGVAEVINALQMKSWSKFLAFSMKVGSSWLVFLSGLITVVVGAVIPAHWPVESLYVLGIFLGVDLVVMGVGWISIGLGLKSRV
jgi:uncharacterized membrane protein HdeD (DUF308 family)